jgi:hypothetical protein
MGHKNRNINNYGYLISVCFGSKTVLISDTRGKTEVRYRKGYLHDDDVSSKYDCRTTPISNNPPIWVRTGRVRYAAYELDC